MVTCPQVLKFQEAQNRVSASNDFFRGLSKEADLVMDGDLLMVRYRTSHHFRSSYFGRGSFLVLPMGYP